MTNICLYVLQHGIYFNDILKGQGLHGTESRERREMMYIKISRQLASFNQVF